MISFIPNDSAVLFLMDSSDLLTAVFRMPSHFTRTDAVLYGQISLYTYT